MGRKYHYLIWIALLVLPACNRPAEAIPTNISLPVPTQAFPTSPAATAVSQAGPGVQITSPQNGAQLPENTPLDVQYTASGGPFMEASLVVDDTLTAVETINSQEPVISGTLTWTAPAAGSHLIQIKVLTPVKDVLTGQIQVTVGGGGPVSPTVPAPGGTNQSTGGMQISFLNLADGATVAATLDNAGKPQVTVSIEVTGVAPVDIGLTANDTTAGVQENPSGMVPFRADILWSPVGGAGTYTLTAGAINADKSASANASITVTVTGVSVIQLTPTPAPMDPAVARQRIIQLFPQEFGLNLPSPPVARKFRQGVPNDPWVSVIFLQDKMYQISLRQDGTYDRFSFPLNKPTPGYSSMCRSSGILKILVVFLDFGNLGVSQQEALDALKQSTLDLNNRFASYSQTYGVAQPILQLQTTGYVIPPPTEMPAHLLTPAIIQAKTGIDPRQFDLTVQVDLDANNTYRKIIASQGFDTFGFAGPGCGDTPNTTSIWTTIESKDQLYGEDSRLTTTALSHEVLHTMGYPASHDWPCTDGTTIDQGDQCDYRNWPVLELGWMDTDGDGVVEIFDTGSPYGMIK